jgi:type II secretion system protein G
MNNYQVKQRKGFTLIEIMLVIALIGILVAAGLGSFTSSQTKGRDSKRKNDLSHMAEALEIYYNDIGQYPNSDGSGNMLGCGAGALLACSWGGIFSNTTNSVIYMIKLPSDPASGRKYFYRKSGTGYQLYAALENSQDSSYYAAGYSGTNCSTGVDTLLCTYGVASSNKTP